MTKRVLLSLIILSFSLTGWAQKKVRLRMNLEAGKTYPVYVESDQLIAQELMGQSQETDVLQGIGYDMEVLSSTKKAIDIKLTYTRVKIVQNSPLGAVSYDSENPPEEIPPMASGFVGLLNQSFYMTMTPRGAVQEVRGVDEMFEEMIKAMEANGQVLPEAVRMQLKNQFGTEALQSNLSQMFDFYPKKKIRPGDSWTKSGTYTQGMSMNLVATYTLESVENGVARLKVESTIQTDPNTALELGPMTMNYDLAGKQEGYSILDIKTGWVKNSVMNQSMEGDASVDMGGQLMEFPMKIVSVVTMNPQ